MLRAAPPAVRNLRANLPGLPGGGLLAGTYPEYPAATLCGTGDVMPLLHRYTNICWLVSVDGIDKAQI